MIELHDLTKTAVVDGKPVPLTWAEYELLYTLVFMGKDRIATHRELILHTIGHTSGAASDKNLLRLRVWRIRKKIGFDAIATRPAVGYLLAKEIRFTEKSPYA